jgi:hypothetical protein|tara:strand:+ start:454 stop:630 length:177 start_codon:yes stop_codon:yes gene_type:complete
MSKKTKQKLLKPRDPNFLEMVKRNGKGAHGVKSNKTKRRQDKVNLMRDLPHKDMRIAA